MRYTSTLSTPLLYWWSPPNGSGRKSPSTPPPDTSTPPTPAAKQLLLAWKQDCNPHLHTSTSHTLPNPSPHLVVTSQRQRPRWLRGLPPPSPHTSTPPTLPNPSPHLVVTSQRQCPRWLSWPTSTLTPHLHTSHTPKPQPSPGGHLPAAAYAVACRPHLHLRLHHHLLHFPQHLLRVTHHAEEAAAPAPAPGYPAPGHPAPAPAVLEGRREGQRRRGGCGRRFRGSAFGTSSFAA